MNRNILLIALAIIVLLIWRKNRNLQNPVFAPNVSDYIMQYSSNADVQTAEQAYQAFLAEQAAQVYRQQTLAAYMNIANQISNIVSSGSEGAFTPNQIWMMESSDY